MYLFISISKGWAMGALLFTSSMKESSPHRPSLQRSILHFLSEGMDDCGFTLHTRGSMEDLERGPYNPQRQRMKISEK